MDRIKTPFGFSSTADEVAGGVDLTGKYAIVTGGSSGIGIDTARVLASAGASVLLAVRKPEAGDTVAKAIRALTGNANVKVARLDLSNRNSIRDFVSAWAEPLHIMINNAGIVALPTLERTADGWEMQFATNFLGHFALTVGLHRALAAAGGARVVSVSCSANLISPVIFDDMHFDFLPYDPRVAFGQSKTACVLVAVEATRRWSQEGIYANSLNPGPIATNLRRHPDGIKTSPEKRKSTAQGAATSVMLATSPLVEGVGGRYFEDCNESEVVRKRPKDCAGVAHYAVDPENAERLWEVAMKLIA